MWLLAQICRRVDWSEKLKAFEEFSRPMSKDAFFFEAMAVVHRLVDWTDKGRKPFSRTFVPPAMDVAGSLLPRHLLGRTNKVGPLGP